MRFLLFLLSLGTAYNIESHNTFCFFVNTECFNSHTKEVEAEINKPKNKDRYISHTSTMHKYGASSMITYKS